MSDTLSNRAARPTLTQVRALFQQLPPASRRKLLADLYAIEHAAEAQEIRAISRAVQADVQAKGLAPITDADIDRELKADRQRHAA